MLLFDPVDDPDEEGPVYALGLVAARYSLFGFNIDGEADRVRKFIAEQGWQRPPTSVLRPLPDVVMIGLDDPAPLNGLLLDCFHSHAHVLVVPTIEHLPDLGEVMSSVINIATVDDGKVLRHRDRDKRFRRARAADRSRSPDLD